MAKSFHHVLAGALLAWLSLPASAEVNLTTEPMTGTGLPPGQTLPAEPQPEPSTPAEPFTPKTIAAEKMQAWGPVANASDDTSTNSGNATPTRPATRQVERLRPRAKELHPLVKPRRKEP